ncbi:hypothetical protein H8D04_00460 [bacterium]|nr:hypothetical protein [bacterium]
MAQYIGEVKGSRGSTSRTGHKTQGLTSSAQGWNMGVKVEMRYESGCDTAYIYRTGGSRNPCTNKLIATVRHDGTVEVEK